MNLNIGTFSWYFCPWKQHAHCSDLSHLRDEWLSCFVKHSFIHLFLPFGSCLNQKPLWSQRLSSSQSPFLFFYGWMEGPPACFRRGSWTRVVVKWRKKEGKVDSPPPCPPAHPDVRACQWQSALRSVCRPVSLVPGPLNISRLPSGFKKHTHTKKTKHKL